jgi:hypothetical protein
MLATDSARTRYETIASNDGRRAIFDVDYAREDYGERRTDTPFVRRSARRVKLGSPRKSALEARLNVHLHAPGARAIRVRYTLPAHHKALRLELLIDKQAAREPEATYIFFPFALTSPRFRLDVNGVPLEPEAEQIPGSCRDWYGIQTWAGVSDGETSVVLVPLDAPLVQVGGIQTGRWADTLDANDATLVSWAMHNHWDTNFKAAQHGDVTLRYELTSYASEDWTAASRFAMEAVTPPLIVGVPGAAIDERGQFVDLEPEGSSKLYLKRAADGNGIIVQAFNMTQEPLTLRVRLAHSRLKCNDPDVQGTLPHEECDSQATCAVAG